MIFSGFSKKITPCKNLLLMAIFFGSLPACSTMTSKISELNEAPKNHLNEVEGYTDLKLAQDHSRFRPKISRGGMVVSDDPIASEWGAEILRQGGNAIDAAVATAFMLAVTRPHYGSLGGGGFLLYCPKPQKNTPGTCEIIDYRERAPKRAHRDMFVIDGKAQTHLSQNHALSSGTPGVVAGLLHALKKWGSMPRSKLLERPRRLAKQGFPISSYTERAAYKRWDQMNLAAKQILSCDLNPDKKYEPKAPCKAGQLLRQPDLGKVLDEISIHGEAGFYDGWVAQKIVSGLKAQGGILELDDLKNYSVRTRAPLIARFSNREIVTMPPPSAGGTTLIQMLRYAEAGHKKGWFSDGFGSVSHLNGIAQAMKLAYEDRSSYFGDPDFVDVPTDKLTSEPYLNRRFKTMIESSETTHFSVIDKEGNAVSVTTTVNDNFGSAQVPPGTGIFMNNEMDDFAIQPDLPNLFGLVQGEKNTIAPFKRPVSSMSPSIVRDLEGNNLIVIGAAGGPRITTSVFQALINRYYFGMSLIDAVNAPRIHHQWKPDELMVERYGFAPEVRAELVKKGHKLKTITESARIHALERFPNSGYVMGAPDRRAEGEASIE
jgi:gamma-glutamyltranspeptidase/glutathione hydrolase